MTTAAREHCAILAGNETERGSEMKEPMSRLRRITHWTALVVGTSVALVSLLFPPPSRNPVHMVIGAVAFGLGGLILVWGIGLTIETEGARLRTRLEHRWSSESNGA